MEIPATSAGISTMVSNTGCALACHETNYTDSEYTTHYTGWGKTDSYTYAENNGITLRIDNVRAAAQSLVTTAQSMMTSNSSVYQMAAYTFSDGVNQLLTLNPTTSANVPTDAIGAGWHHAALDERQRHSGVRRTYTYPKTSSSYTTVTLKANTSNDDAGTNFNYAMTALNAAMPKPGQGTSKSGDTPQEVLMIVTDGVDDVSLYNSSSCATSQVWSYSNTYGSFYRCEQPVNMAQCAADQGARHSHCRALHDLLSAHEQLMVQ